MKKDLIFIKRTASPGNRSCGSKGLPDYIKLCFPILLFPILYFPYTMWWRAGFAALAGRIIHSFGVPAFRLMITGNNTILLFWGLVTVLVMLGAIVISIFRVRPWYIIPLYLAVMFSLCGICSLALYTAILS